MIVTASVVPVDSLRAVGQGRILVIEIAGEIEFGITIVNVARAAGGALAVNTVRIHEVLAVLGGRALLVVVVHQVEVTAFAAVGAVVAPVVDHVVAHIHPFICLSTWSRTKSGCT